MDKKKIQELMEKRSSAKREKVKPVNFFETDFSQQTSKTVKQQNGKTAKQQDKTAPENKEKTITKQKKRNLTKYTTYLPEDLIIKIKMQAILQRKKSYEIVIEALQKSLQPEQIT